MSPARRSRAVPGPTARARGNPHVGGSRSPGGLHRASQVWGWDDGGGRRLGMRGYPLPELWATPQLGEHLACPSPARPPQTPRGGSTCLYQYFGVGAPGSALRYLSVYLSLHPSCFSTSLRSYPNPCCWPPVLAGLFLCGLRLQADFCPDVRSLLAGRPVQTRRGLAGSLPKGHPSVPLLEASRLGFLLLVC